MQEPEDIAKLRDSGVLAFNQLPLLQIDGLNLVQSGATIRYLARRGNLLGGTDPKDIVMYVRACTP
jgi:glutathione S-transferase